MSEEEKPKEKLIRKIGEELVSKDESTVRSALKKTEKHGDVAHVRPLLVAFKHAKEGKLKEELREVLSTLKLSGAEGVFMEALEDEEFDVIRAEILSFCWNAGFQPVDALDLISKISLEGDFMTAVEGLTLIESMAGPMDEESLFQALIYLREFLKDHKDDGHPNYEIALTLYGVLSAHERNA